MIKIEKDKIELALYVINLKIADIMKNNKDKDYNTFKKELIKLQDEKDEIYKQNEVVIEKVLNVYLKEVKRG